MDFKCSFGPRTPSHKIQKEPVHYLINKLYCFNFIYYYFSDLWPKTFLFLEEINTFIIFRLNFELWTLWMNRCLHLPSLLLHCWNSLARSEWRRCCSIGTWITNKIEAVSCDPFNTTYQVLWGWLTKDDWPDFEFDQHRLSVITNWALNLKFLPNRA